MTRRRFSGNVQPSRPPGRHVERAHMHNVYRPPPLESRLLGALRYCPDGAPVELLAAATLTHLADTEQALRSMVARGLVIEQQRPDGPVWVRVAQSEKGGSERVARD